VAFVAPSRADMQAIVLRALRDPNGEVFLPETINDIINEGLSDLSSYRPKDAVEVQPWPLVTDPMPFIGFIDIWSVQYRVIDPNDSTHYVQQTTIPFVGRGTYEARNGWDYFAHALTLSDMWSRQLSGLTAQSWSVELVVLGYADRDLPDADDDILDLEESVDYLCLLNHCKALGMELLTHDRSLYQQWAQATNNTDVSPTQLQGMATLAAQTYDRMRSRNIRLRRIPAGDLAFSY
jgi:hypothetical protein